VRASSRWFTQRSLTRAEREVATVERQAEGSTSRKGVSFATGRPLTELWLRVGPGALVLALLTLAALNASPEAPAWATPLLVVIGVAAGLALSVAIGRLQQAWAMVHQQRVDHERRCSQTLESAADGILSVDIKGCLAGADDGAAALFGYSVGELSGVPLSTLIQLPAAPDESVDNADASLPAFGERVQARGTSRTKRSLALDVISVAPPRADGSQVWLLLWDRTEFAEAKRKVARLEFIAEESPHPIVEVDAVGDLSFTNASADRLFPDLKGQASSHLLLQELESISERLRRGGESSLIREITVGAGLWEQHIAYVPSTGTLRVFSFDVTDRREALRDVLTGLPNRASFMRRLNRVSALADGDPSYAFAVLFLDLDRFKVLNDTLGHATGDDLLKAVAGRLEACLRPNDMVARMGGDEFTILLDGVRDQSESEAITARILERLHAAFELNAQTVFTSASVGIAMSPVGYDEPADMVAFADAAMYRAKTEGRARQIVFDASVDGQAVPGRLF